MAVAVLSSCRIFPFTELSRPASCVSIFSAKMVSCCNGRSSNTDFRFRGKTVAECSNVCFIKTNRNLKFTHIGNHQTTNFKLVKSLRTFYSRWIFTSTSQLDWKKTLSRKSIIKERIGKVKEIVHRESILTIPNLLSTFRIAAAPFLGYFIISEQFLIAVMLFGIAGITDMLDGYIARNFQNQKSIFGTILDPVADKVLMCVLAISLATTELLPIPLAALIVGRDLMLVLSAFYFRFKSLPSPRTLSRYFDVNLATVELRPNFLGKSNTVLQLGLVGCTLLASVMGYVDHWFLHVLWYLVGTSTVISSVSYVVSANKAIRYLNNE